MNKKTLEDHFFKNRALYADLAYECGSVQELTVRLTLMGEKWTRWDWAMFVCYLDSAVFQWKRDMRNSWCDDEPAEKPAPVLMLKSLYEALDTENSMDGIFTNRTVITSMIELAGKKDLKFGPGIACRKEFVFSILARVFRKFPPLWNMNYMWIRHTGGGRTHRLAELAFPDMVRPAGYYESSAYLEDFISRYWKKYV